MEYDIPVTTFKVVKNALEAISFADEIGYPVVLKIISPDIIHKFDVGGVILNLNEKKEVREAFKKITRNVKKQT